jgi:hypothetical protein
MLVVMKRHLALAGKSLAAAGLTGVVLYVVGTATQRTWPLWPYFIFGVMLLLGGLLYVLGQGRTAPDSNATEVPDDPEGAEGPPLTTDKWRYTSNGGEAPSLMMITHKGFSHHGYMRSPPENPPPYVRMGVLVACDPFGSLPTTSALRDRLLDFLGRAPVSALVSELTHVGQELAWRSYASNGRIHNEAVLTASDDQTEAPVASVMLNLNEAGQPRYGHDPRTAEFVLHIEPQTHDGKPAPPADLKAWHDRLVRALDVPGAFADFLSEDLGLTTHGDPPAQLGIELRAYRSITELIDPGDHSVIAGSTGSSQFTGYMISSLNGISASDVAVEMLTGICDHALHLHGYEDELDLIRRRLDPIHLPDSLDAE